MKEMTAQELWHKYAKENTIQNMGYEAWCFGDDPDKLAELVLSGEKTEGDKSLAYWRTVHEDFFREELTNAGKTFDEKMDIVCEEFKVVYKLNDKLINT
jgi:uncharacterized protein YhfF